MHKSLNNKGYMLVEIILASVLAMVVAYFMIDLTIKLKNKNDDLLVKTLVYTDQAIIYNTIMKDLYTTTENINCAYVDNKLDIDISNKVFEYDGFKNIVSEYADVGSFTCNDVGTNSVSIDIPIKVEQLPDEVFDISINYYQKSQPSDSTPTTTPSVPDTSTDTDTGDEETEDDSSSGSVCGSTHILRTCGDTVYCCTKNVTCDTIGTSSFCFIGPTLGE